LITSFNIPLGIIYDIDCSDIQKEDEEKALNEELEKYKTKGVSVWGFDKKYEDELKKSLGDDVYQNACQKYSKTAKPTRARLIASDDEYSIPEFIKPIIKWLSGEKIEEHK